MSQSMEACPQMKYELVVQRKEGYIFSYHVQKDQKFKRKFTFDIPKFKFQNRKIVNPVNNAEILPPELVGDQSEMVVLQFFHTFFILMWL